MGVSFGVVGVKRLYGPTETHGRDPIPLLVSVDHDRHAVIPFLAQGFHPFKVDGNIGLCDFNLDPFDAFGWLNPGFFDNLLDGA